ncbi:MAG TPA: multicopper oxidase [Jiangellales bacterium]|nr:multicopper oxidase [Jiangellales bacterium]
MIARRNLLIAGAVGGASLVLPQGGSWARAQAVGLVGTLEPGSIPKYVTPLVIPPVMPPVGVGALIDRYAIGVRQFSQQVLPPNLPRTAVWGYGSVVHGTTFNSPAFTIEARVDRPVRVTWINDLVNGSQRFREHLLPVDPTLHWANPPGGTDGRDSRPTFTTTPDRYRGPVPIVTHLHGGHSREESDGYAEAWFLPHARNIPDGFARVGSFYDEFRDKFAARHGVKWRPGTATFQYDNDQRATTEWYHDHVLGMTRLNVYAGLAGFYLLRGGESDLPKGVLPGPAPALGDHPSTAYFEIPIAIQDRSFNADGSLFYPDSRAFFDGFPGPYIPDSDISPIWNPEFFGNAMMVNGGTWPVLDVEPRRYRLRLLNGCNSRFLILKIASDPDARPADPALQFWQIGNDGGFLPEPVRLEQLLMSPAERADVIVDFTGLPEGTARFLINVGPDEPFAGGIPGTDFPSADPQTTGQVMKFRVGKLSGPDTSTPPDQLTLPTIMPLGQESVTRQLSLNELDSEVLPGVGPRVALLGTVADGPLEWGDAITENPGLNATEIWEFHNFTADAHPMHIHEVQFQVINRQAFGGPPRDPEVWEQGFKDMIIAYPGEITRVKAHFDLPGRYVWHCHIVEHEDNEMMRPYQVGP